MATPRRLRGKVTDREQELSLVTEALPDVKESDSRDGLKAPVRRRSSVRARSDAPPDPSSGTRAPALKGSPSKKTPGVSTCILSVEFQEVQGKPDANRTP